MATLVSDIIHKARTDYFLTGHREERNKLSGAHTSTTGTIAFTYDANSIKRGARLAMGTEDCYVWASTANSATADPGAFGTLAQSHADGEVVVVNPIVSDAQWLRAINDVITELSSPVSGLYQMKTLELTFSSATYGYDLTAATDLRDVYAVYYDYPGTANDWPEIRSWEVRHSAETDDFPSGKQLVIHEAGYQGNQLRVLYKAGFTNVTATTDDMSTTNMPTTAYDLVALGAAIRVGAGREVKRNLTETQGDTRRANEVPAYAALASTRGLPAQYEGRLADEVSRLPAKYPPRMRQLS